MSKPKQQWYRKSGHRYRVMCEAEGYVMIRAKGCAPFVISKKNLLEDYYKLTGNKNHG